MIISPSRNYIFVHVPKTGGTSLALALEGRARSDDILIGDTPKAKRRRRRLKNAVTAGRLWKHSTIYDIDGLVSHAFVQQSFVFAMVRNPWDRMVSYYHWLLEQQFNHPAVHLAKRTDFKQFLRSDLTRSTFQAHPYSNYMRDVLGHETDALYIRLEEFECDAVPLWRHLGFKLDLPHENQSTRHRDYRHYYDDVLVEVLAEVCAEDILRFGYSFE